MSGKLEPSAEPPTIQLDRTRIAIRQRSFPDLLDLALRVVRLHAAPLATAWAMGVVPVIALNAWLLAGFTEPDPEMRFPATYAWYMLLLVIGEIPLATAPITLYLGRAMFTDRPRPGQMVRDFFHGLPQMLLYQVIVRALMVPLCVTWFLPLAVWPYLSEVILLERNPMRARARGQMTTYRRALALHGGYVADLFARWMGAVGVGLLLLASIWLSIWFLRWRLLGEWQFEGPTFTVWFPLAIWLTVGYFAVVRFLCYLDLRIRREGWEVELAMRAEGARVARKSV